MVEYPKVDLGDLAASDKWAITIGPFGSKMKSDLYVSDGVPVIRGANISDGNEITGDWVFVTEDFAQTVPNCITHAGELLFPHRGAIGEVALVKDTHPKMVISSSLMKFRPDKKKAIPEYLFYFFSSDDGRREILRFSSSVGTPGIGQPLTSLRQFSVPLPDLHTQSKIAGVLSTLDDKIELNRRMNETLQALAQAVFKDWFVDFGPVCRKLDGSTDPVAILGGLLPNPEKAAPIAALFPAIFREDGLPEGWVLQTVDNLMELAYGKSLPKTSRRKGRFPVYGSGGINGTHDGALVSGPGIVVGRKGTVGSLFWEQADFFPIDTVFYVKPAKGVALEFLWFLLKSLGLEHMNTDAAVPGLNRTNVYRLEVPNVPAKLIEAFATIARPLRAKHEANNAESRTLAETRDYLLPKLMSGAVRVRDAEALRVPTHDG
jgi:type I restriction enzyme, S subunit